MNESWIYKHLAPLEPERCLVSASPRCEVGVISLQTLYEVMAGSNAVTLTPVGDAA